MKIIPLAAVGSALPVSGKEVLAPENIRKQEGRLKSALRFTGRSSVEGIRWASYSALVGAALLFTANGNKLLHDVGQSKFHIPYTAKNIVGLVPKPVARAAPSEINRYKFDSFYSNQKDFSRIENIINLLNIKPENIDSNNDGIILDTREDVIRLYNILASQYKSSETSPELKDQIKEAANVLSLIDEHDQIVFGRNGVDPETFDQGGIPNCQILAALKGLSFTPENIQILRSMITVSDYNYTPGNSSIGVEVDIDGKKIPIDYSKLVKWMSPLYYSPTHADDGSLALPILAAAIEEAGKAYDTVPHTVPSTSPILITGNDYYVLSTWSLDDDDIRSMLSLAPNELITVSSYPQDSSFKGLISSAIDAAKEKLIPEQQPVLSEGKAIAFMESVNQRVQEIVQPTQQVSVSGSPTDTNSLGSISVGVPASQIARLPELTENDSPQILEKPASALISAPQVVTTQQTYLSDIVPLHQYAIKSYHREGNEDVIILTDSHGVEYKPLSLKEFREKLGVIVVAKDKSPFTTNRSLLIMSLLALMGTLVRTGANRTNKLINPAYQNLLNSFVSRGVNNLLPNSRKTS